jgi:hypothetical protein
VCGMGHSATTKAARRAARVAAVAAQEELARRTRANVEDLAAYFSAQQRAEAVDDWLKEKVQVLAGQAGRRRLEQRRRCGAALRSMKDRGESLREIAGMAGIGEKAVRELIRLAERETGEEVGPAGVNGSAGSSGARSAPSDAAVGGGVGVRGGAVRSWS